MSNKQPDALRLADQLEGWFYPDDCNMEAIDSAAAELRTQHAAIERKDALLRQALDALENHAGNYKLSKAEGTIVSAVVDAITKELQ